MCSNFGTSVKLLCDSASQLVDDRVVSATGFVLELDLDALLVAASKMQLHLDLQKLPSWCCKILAALKSNRKPHKKKTFTMIVNPIASWIEF